MRRGDDELKRHVDECIEKLIDEGAVSQALSSYHVPYFPVFDVVDKADPDEDDEYATDDSGSVSADDDGIIRHQPTDRGPEPQMQRRQRSKQRLSGMRENPFRRSVGRRLGS